jgi:hypothetical protein
MAIPGPAVQPAAIAGSAAAVAVSVPADTEAHCRSLATQRMRDSEANGYDADLQQQVFNGTWRDCMAWAARHP